MAAEGEAVSRRARGAAARAHAPGARGSAEAARVRPPPPPGSYLRGGRGLEFDRVSIFSDAVYAIALTLLVVALVPPTGPGLATDGPALWRAIWSSQPNILGFFIGFALLGRYWLAHHEFFAGLRSIDRPLIALNLVYLAFVAFMPYPVGLISEHERNPVAFFLFAGCMALISCLELAMFAWAARRGHTLLPLSRAVIRFGLVAAGAPVVVMLASMPLALVDTSYALLSWLVLIPLGAWMTRRNPQTAAAERRE
jgi:uncharacterized membrane protein